MGVAEVQAEISRLDGLLRNEQQSVAHKSRTATRAEVIELRVLQESLTRRRAVVRTIATHFRAVPHMAAARQAAESVAAMEALGHVLEGMVSRGTP